MFCISIRAVLAVSAALLASCAKHYRAEGVVMSVDRAHQTLVISHRAIPGYMEAMSMPFRVEKAAEIGALAPGARIDFRLNVGRKGSSISRVRMRQAAFEDAQLFQPAARKLTAGDAAPDFTLIDQVGRAVHLSDFRGQVTAIDFIYTRCPLPDVCPRLSANFAFLQRRFGDRVTLLSVTIDPVYDTPEVLAGYARRWQAGPQWRFLTGSAEQIRQTAAPYGLVYWPEDGSISHSSVTGVIGRDGRVAAMLEGSTFTAAQLADLVRAVLEPVLH